MIDEKGFVGLDVGKFEIFSFASISGLAFSVPNTPSGHATLKDKIGALGGQIIAKAGNRCRFAGFAVSGVAAQAEKQSADPF